MTNILIILAGYPATGKTYIIEQLNKKMKDLESISIDEIEEKLYEYYGFKNSSEKKALYNKSFEEFYKVLEELMIQNKDIAIDYPFSYLQYDKLKYLVDKYGYKALTIRLVGDIEIIFQRRVKRDLNENRHPAHLLDKYEPGMKVSEKMRRDNLITLEDFKNHCELRKYSEFSLGKLLSIDASNRYADIDEIYNFISKEARE